FFFFAPLLRLGILICAARYTYLVTSAMFCRADALALGMLAAVAWQNPNFRLFLKERPEVLRRVVLILLALLMALLYWLEMPVGLVKGTIGYSCIAIFYVSLLLYVLSNPQSWFASAMRARPLMALGTISYCVYLVHSPILIGLHRLLLHSNPQLNDAHGGAVTLLAFATTLALAAVSWRLYEIPMIRRGHRHAY